MSTAGTSGASRSDPVSTVLLPPDYRPSDDEEFMNPLQLEFFRRKLLDWRDELLQETSETLVSMQQENLAQPDLADRASMETDRSIELRTRDRERKLISKIDEALLRIQDNSFGWCEETGDPISLRRLGSAPYRHHDPGSPGKSRTLGTHPPRRLARIQISEFLPAVEFYCGFFASATYRFNNVRFNVAMQ